MLERNNELLEWIGIQQRLLYPVVDNVRHDSGRQIEQSQALIIQGQS